MRKPNTIDFWRGFALIEIMINHIPDNGYWRITHRQFSWSDAAELLVFLAGCTTGIRFARWPRTLVGPLVLERLRKIYVGHLAFSLIIAGLYVFAHDKLGDRTILTDNHIDLARSNPGEFLLGLFALVHHVRFFDILSLYFVLTLWTPFMLALDRVSRTALVAVSVTIYAIAAITRVNVPLWPDEGNWAFNPLAWQLVFTLGYLIGSRREAVGEALTQWAFVTPLAWAIVVVSFVCMLKGLPHPNPEARGPLEGFLWSKTYDGPMRPLQLLALVHVGQSLTWLAPRFTPTLWALLSLLGRNSLSVFCGAAVLSAIGQIAHRAGWHGAAFDTLFNVGAVAVMAALACLHESLRRRARTPTPADALTAVKQTA